MRTMMSVTKLWGLKDPNQSLHLSAHCPFGGKCAFKDWSVGPIGYHVRLEWDQVNCDHMLYRARTVLVSVMLSSYAFSS